MPLHDVGLISTGIELSGVPATDFAAAFRLRVSLALFAASLRFLAATFAFRVAAAFTAAWLRFIASAFALRVAAALFAAALRFLVAAALLAAALRSVALFIARSITGEDDPGVVLRQFDCRRNNVLEFIPAFGDRQLNL